MLYYDNRDLADLPGEIWKQAVYDGVDLGEYQVSNLARVKSPFRRRCDDMMNIQERILTQIMNQSHKNSGKALRVTIRIHPHQYTMYVSTLVGNAFLGKADEYRKINGDWADCRAENLRKN